jgi:hypothetical protein
VNGEDCDLLAESNNFLNRWKKYFSQLLNVHTVSHVRQIEIQTTEPLVPDPSSCKVEIAIEKLKNKSPGSDQILAELIQVGSEMLWSEIHELLNSISNREELPNQ